MERHRTAQVQVPVHLLGDLALHLLQAGYWIARVILQDGNCKLHVMPCRASQTSGQTERHTRPHPPP